MTDLSLGNRDSTNREDGEEIVRMLLISDFSGEHPLLRVAAGHRWLEGERIGWDEVTPAAVEGVDVVVLDLAHLPDTFEKPECLDPLPCLLLTPSRRGRFAERMLHLGADDYLVAGETEGEQLHAQCIYAIDRHRLTGETRVAEPDGLASSEVLCSLYGLLETVEEGVVIADETGKFRYWNPTAQRLVGRGITTLPPSAWPEYYGVFRDEGNTPFPSEELPIVRALAGESVQDVEMFVRNPDLPAGVWLRCTAAPIGPQDGRRLGAILLFHDITHQKTREAMIAQKTRDLETLLYIVSHDLREPLRTIESFAELLRWRYEGILPPKARQYLERIERGCQRLSSFLSDILQLSRARTQELPRNPIGGKEIVQEVLQRLQGAIRRRNARIVVEERFPVFHVNRTWAVEALYNLVANALKFSRADTPPEVEIGVYRPPDLPGQQGFVVRDRGPGVLPEKRERIFELFDRGGEREIEGTGAGLAIVRAVAERHGGRTDVLPRPGGGSEFFITFSFPSEPADTVAVIAP